MRSETKSVFFIYNQLPDRADRHKRTKVLFTALHHAREPTSLTVLLTTLIHQLRQLHKDPNSELFFQTDIIFVPVVNVDSYLIINENWAGDEWESARMLRKNQHDDDKCSKWTQGVDLNRNYGFKWNRNPMEGGSNKPCDIDYRGPKAFSEPETKAMKRFVEDRPEIVSAMNFHAWGDLWIMPFNYINDSKDRPLEKMPKFYKVYEQFSKTAPHQAKAK